MKNVGVSGLCASKETPFHWNIQGVQGTEATGAKGDTGVQGTQGAQGLKGDTGVQGPQGAPGVPVAGPVYHIGDVGPDGGIVFFVDGSGFHGLEAQASDALRFSKGEMLWQYAKDAAMEYNITPITTALLCSVNARLTPNCWHLPTRNELRKLYEQRDVVGGFTRPIVVGINSTYWNDFGGVIWFFNADSLTADGISNKLGAGMYRVRAVRAF